MYAFDYLRPASLTEAVAMLADNPEGKALSGGHTLIPAMKLRLTGPAALVDLNGLAELRGIKLEGDTLIIGALSRHHEVANSDVVKQAIPVLAEMVGTIGDPAVRHRGTIGGSLANNDPSADYAAAAMALGATVVTDRRRIAADDYFQGLFTTALEEGEIVTAVEFPIPKRMGYSKFRNPASRYALCAVCVAQTASGETRVSVIGAGADGVFRASAFEAALASDFSAKALEGLSVPPDDMASDIHADQDYRAHLVGVMARRAVAGAK
ncbi:FAD binding domain-containing protein [Enterovirga rhinocerotis]|uniref:Carbon-monoxide dehydrogenase medium subunit n=1 Tax=Enterovirga rhinocerotis TaxID=1339210 RepID=A0A4R7C710_9HYPH|nr:xanthine dehydrogenase family protein subunit M [Enterovirga rhinocerotis]TDR93025.1 carbon-monoxide dehydrogenase medium subunit [Enterovirga rhinocerotis]